MYEERWDKLQVHMRASGVSGFLVTQNVGLYYMTGSMQSGYLMIPAEGDPVFYVRRSVSRATGESACETRPLGSFRRFGERLRADFPKLFADESSVTLALEYDVIPAQIYERLRRLLPDVAWRDGSAWMREIRMVKSREEVSRIRKAAAVADQALSDGLGRLTAGMSELELMANIELSLRLQGHSGIMRMRGYNQEIITGMIGSGSAAAVPTYFEGPAGGQGLGPAVPQSVSRKKIHAGEPILVDIGCNVDGYVIDQTRTAVIGTLPSDLEEAYTSAEIILRETEEQLKPGTSCEAIYVRALERVRGMGLSEHFMGYGDDRVKFLGHGIGLEIDEWPVLAKGFDIPLQPGMVIAVEPKFTFPDRGVVGIENTYLITEGGCECLTISPEGIWYIED